MYNIAIILAAGSGRRMCSTLPKQFMRIKNKEVLLYSLEAFEKSKIDEIIVVSQSEYRDKISLLAKSNNINKLSIICDGGKERYLSVYNAIINIKNENANVFIHDGARPLIKPEKIDEMIEKLEVNKNLVLAVPVKDTIRVSDALGVFSNCLERDKLYAIQTPQAFKLKDLRLAYERYFKADDYELKITDDAMLIENFLNIRIHYILGEYSNIKITTKDDIYLAKAYLDMELEK